MRHEKIEKNINLMMVLIVIAISIGGLVEIIPLMLSSDATEPAEGIEAYEPLRLAGRDIYVREGCYNCHSQMVRPFRFETLFLHSSFFFLEKCRPQDHVSCPKGRRPE